MQYIVKKLLCFLFLFTLTLYPAGCSHEDSTEDRSINRVVSVKLHKVDRGRITSFLEVTGTTLPIEEARVGAKVEGTITEIFVDEGDTVKKGQVLVRLDPKDFLLDIDRTTAALRTSQAELETAKHDLEQKSKDWKRISALYERRVIAKHRYDSMMASYSIAQSKVREYEAMVKQRQAELGLAEKKYKDSEVRAPLSGVVTKKFLHEGEVSSLWAYNWETLELMDISKIKVECDVSEKWKNRLKKGLEAEVLADAYPEEKFKGKITTINPMVDPIKRTFKIKIVIPNPEKQLTAGMFARIKIVLESKGQALLIPTKDILERTDGNFIFVVEDGIAHQRKISLGIKEEFWVEVTQGLKEGEFVVIEGSHRLQDGYQIEAIQ
jgi:RND family efflux transporter MFP subunit